MLRTKIRIIDAIRNGKNTCSKKEVSLKSGVSWGAMYKIVDTLLAEGTIFTRTEKPTGRGRPNTPLCLNPEAAFFAGIDIGSENTRIVFVDLNLLVRHSESLKTQSYKDEKSFWAWVYSVYKSALEKSGLSASQINSIGVGISGTVDSENGLIFSAGNLRIPRGTNLNVKQFSELCGISACIYTTQVAAAIAEYHFGSETGVGNLATVGLGVGIGSGAVANHVLLISHPKHPIGYIGHILIPNNERECVCGWNGCLEAYSGGNNLVAVASEMFKNTTIQNSARAIDDLAVAGDKTARKILNKAAAYNAVGVANMIQLYSPEAVIFSGGQSKEDGYLYNQTIKEVKKLLPGGRDICRFSITRLGEFQSAIGAARLAYENFF